MNHASISDPYLHEPKGASTAQIGTVYYSNGQGSGTWGKLPQSSIALNPSEVSDYTYTAPSETSLLVYNGLVQLETSQIEDLSVNSGISENDLAKLNQNFYNIFKILDNHKSILDTVSTNLKNVSDTLQAVVTVLKANQLIQGESTDVQS